MDPVHQKVAIPRRGELVAPCFGYSATVSIFAVADGAVAQQTDFILQSPRDLDRLRLLRDQGVDTLICGGVQERFENLIRASGIRVISWVSGDVEDLLGAFLRGELKEPSRHHSPSPTTEPERKPPER
jgi:predicted Fe-Mo cluster-binding NifX family protein